MGPALAGRFVIEGSWYLGMVLVIGTCSPWQWPSSHTVSLLVTMAPVKYGPSWQELWLFGSHVAWPLSSERSCLHMFPVCQGPSCHSRTVGIVLVMAESRLSRSIPIFSLDTITLGIVVPTSVPTEILVTGDTGPLAIAFDLGTSRSAGRLHVWQYHGSFVSFFKSWLPKLVVANCLSSD